MGLNHDLTSQSAVGSRRLLLVVVPPKDAYGLVGAPRVGSEVEGLTISMLMSSHPLAADGSTSSM